MIGREAEPGAKVEAERPGRSNSASPSEVGCARCSSALETTVTEENVSATTGSTPFGSRGGGLPRPRSRTGAVPTTESSSRATSWAEAGSIPSAAAPRITMRKAL
ncbi:hypothetical protein AOPFMNJM_0899 [Methylobacterium jeotgali]|uniref:Uncharacterized protein n=1 Tax=Methylobacterium jeotgali TaxID=381630 RepID=A0ABQ4STN8_9HYPH|nr:hypothetical protein AOPFMNJM_0899 [Methylobacterium jeotgali]